MNTLIVAAAVIALSISSVAANAQSLSYNAPAHNYQQNNWMSSRG